MELIDAFPLRLLDDVMYVAENIAAITCQISAHTLTSQNSE